MYYPKKTAKKTKTTPKVKKYTKTLNKQIAKVIKQQSDLKTAANLTIADQVLVTGAGLNTPFGLGWVSNVSILPLITQGAGAGNRIGNNIRPKNLSLRFTLRALPTTDFNSPTNTNPFKGIPFLVRVIVFNHRWAIDEGSQTGILENGNSSQNLGSTPDNWVMPYNKEEYKIHCTRQYTMAALSHVSSTGLLNTENQGNGIKNFIVHRCNIKLPQIIKFNDNNGAPTNAGPFMAVAICNTDGSVVSSAQTRLQLNAEAYLTYYDN